VLSARPAPDAAGAERRIKPGGVGGRAEGDVDRHGARERGPGLAAVAGAEEVLRGRL
jgi:hypothetical protein